MPDVDVEQLQCFIAVAEERHFGRAAARLLLTPSTLSKRCAKLEQELGVRLFDRTTRRVQLSSAGVVMIDSVRRVLAEVDSLRGLADEAAQGRAGRLVVAYSSGNGELVAEMVHTLRSDSPNVEVRLQECLSIEVGPLVSAGNATVGVCRNGRPRGLKTLILTRRWLSHVLVPADDRLALLSEVGPADLDGEVLLVPTAAVHRYSARTDIWRTQGANVSVRCERITSESQIVNSVAAGLGMSLVDGEFLERNPAPGVVARPLVEALVPKSISSYCNYLVWRPDDTSAIVRQFVHIARSRRDTRSTGLPRRSSRIA
jgi:DNA-binding transcriptional LysR family regulator